MLGALLWATSACAGLPGFDDPEFGAHPYYTLYEVEGRTNMQYQVGSSIFDSSSIQLTDIGMGDHQSDFGGGVTYGDGFSGLALDTLLMEQKPKNTEILPANYGVIPAGEPVRTEFKMTEVRMSYTAQVYEFQHEEDEWWVKLGVGPMLSYERIKLRVGSTSDTAIAESFTLDGGIPFPVVTVAAGRGPVSVTTTFAYNHDIAIGSDLEGTFQDIQVRASYYMEDQDLTIFAGWRRLDVGGSETVGGLKAEADYKISGGFLGLEWRF